MLDEEQRRQFICSALHTHCNLLALRENMEQFQPRVVALQDRSLLGTINDLLFEYRLGFQSSLSTTSAPVVIVIKLCTQLLRRISYIAFLACA